jgi:hypothetical protein
MGSASEFRPHRDDDVRVARNCLVRLVGKLGAAVDVRIGIPFAQRDAEAEALKKI